MKPIRLDPAIVKRQIDNLLVQWPELAEDEQLRADMIEGETDAFEFLRLIERKRQDACTLAGAVAGNIAELELRQKRFERREQAMRALAHKIMDAAKLRTIELPEATNIIAKGRDSVIVNDEEAVPLALCKVKFSPDKTAIKEVLDAGVDVSWAEIKTGDPVLTVRTK
jgi:hypothetical protein